MGKQTGISMQLDRAYVRFGKPLRSGKGTSKNAKLTSDLIPEIRKLLRTEMSILEIGSKFGVGGEAMARFIKRRGICDLGERNKFISHQKAIRSNEMYDKY